MNFKKYISLLFFIIFGAMQAMDLASDASLPKITSPYKPGFAVRYPNVDNAARSLLVGGGVAAAGLAMSKAGKGNIEREDLLATGGLGIIAAIGNYLYNLIYPKPIATIDSLLTDPLETSKAHRSFAESRDNFVKENRGHSQKEYLDYFASHDVQKMINKDPISLLVECEEGGRCHFDRSLNTGYRKKFEDYVVLGVVNQINKKQPVNYTSFGSGGGLQDMIVLTKVLAQKPDAQINIHLIDHQNRILVGALDYFKMKREIDVEQADFDFFGDTFNQYVQSIKDRHKSTLADDELKAQFTANCLNHQKKYKQFISFLKKTFPKARLSLFIHESTESCLAYLDKYTLKYPDIVVAADIQDTTGDFFDGALNYMKLCHKSLEKNSEGFNACLAKANTKVNVTDILIISFFLVPSEGLKEEYYQEYRWNEEKQKDEPYGEKVKLYSSRIELN